MMRVLNPKDMEIGIAEFGDNSVRIAAYARVKSKDFLDVQYGIMSDVKAHGSTVEGHWKLENLSAEEESGIPCVAVKCAEIWRNTSGEGDFLVCN